MADVLLFSDTSCSDMLISINGIGTEEEICYGAPADSPLAGVRVVFAHDEPGTCSPTTTVSLVNGTIESGETRTFLPVRSLMGPPDGVFRRVMGPPQSQEDGATRAGA
ncbi:hypothetical protein [Sorangium sp. So ce1335]|uniref:hypothetical protein n=1 Tax=Sorangium sp. So ce1335 TaxID=3133335 RepID=UPI003F612ABF